MEKEITPEELLKCECCGLKDNTVEDLGWALCPTCNEKMGKSIDEVERYRGNTEFDGTGGV